MRSRHLSLLDEIERDALAEDVPLASILRKVVALGAKVGSAGLRDWASRELRGYVGTDLELPDYRKPSAVIKADLVNAAYKITGRQVGTDFFPEGIREHIEEAVPLGQGIGEIEAMLARARAGGGSIRMAFPGSADVARLIDAEVGDPYQQVTAIYWTLGESALAGVTDQVRTTLVELVAEMRANMPDSMESPSPQVADQALNVAVYGDKNRIALSAPHVSGNGHQVSADSGDSGERRSLILKLGAALVGAAAIVSAIVAVAQWQGWSL